MSWNWLTLIPKSLQRAIVKADRQLPPANFFAQIKNKRQTITEQDLKDLKTYIANDIYKFMETGQVRSAERLVFHLKCIEREFEVLKAGITKYVYRDDLDDFICKVSRQVVKIIELSKFERKIPDENAKQIAAVKDLFDQVYIVFTDYTGKEERKVEKRARARDPIAFGAFKSQDNTVWNHRFYYITDWIDEYCDLTLDKYISVMKQAGYSKPVGNIGDINFKDLENAIRDLKRNTNLVREPAWWDTRIMIQQEQDNA